MKLACAKAHAPLDATSLKLRPVRRLLTHGCGALARRPAQGNPPPASAASPAAALRNVQLSLKHRYLLEKPVPQPAP